MDPTSIGNMVTTGGPWALLVTSLMLGWLVPRWFYDKLEADRDYWKAQALRVTKVAETAVGVAEKVT